MQGCFQWKIILFSSPSCLYPSNLSRSPLFYFSWSFLLCYTCACTWNTQSSAGIWVSHSEQGNPIIVSHCFWNEWICTVSSGLDSKADISMTSRHHRVPKHDEPFIPASTEAGGWQGGWHPPGYLRAQGAASSSALLLLPLNREGAVRLFIIYWFYTKGYTTHHQIRFAGWETSKHHWESCKTYRTQKKVFPFLCLSSG